MADTILQISQLTDYSQQLTFNVGFVNGGDVPNRVPSRAEAKAEMRAFAPEIFKAGIDQMLQLNGRSTIHSSDGFPCKVKVELCSSTNPWPINPKTEQLLDEWSIAGAQLGFKVGPEIRSGISDGNLLWQHLPVLDGLGPIGGNAHCSERASGRQHGPGICPYFFLRPKSPAEFGRYFEFDRIIINVGRNRLPFPANQDCRLPIILKRNAQFFQMIWF